jgi:hypothetical protein
MALQLDVTTTTLGSRGASLNRQITAGRARPGTDGHFATTAIARSGVASGKRERTAGAFVASADCNRDRTSGTARRVAGGQ